MMHLKQIARALRGRPSRPINGEKVRGVSTDTRTLHPGDLFFALRGPSFDGHRFLDEAFRKGACAAIVDRNVEGAGPTIVVEDALKAFMALAGAYRMTLGARVVGVTGSNGKTTTKEMLARILGANGSVVKAPGSFNNFVGVPHTIFEADEATEFVVLEIGTNHRGEIARLGEVARPDAAVITCVGASHLEGLGSLDGVADEKTSLLDFLHGAGFAVLHDDPRVLSRVHLPPEKVVTFGMTGHSDLYPTDVEAGRDVRFRVRGVAFRLGLLGEWNVLNALAACGVAMMYGVSLTECARRLAEVRPPKMRMERLELAGVTIINDAYNSNPDSAARAIRLFGRMKAAGRKVAVIGDMLELGPAAEEYHLRIGRLLEESAVDIVVAVGRQSGTVLRAVNGRKEKYGFGCVDEMRPALEDLIRPGDAVLLKGSRGVGLERLVKWMGERLN